MLFGERRGEIVRGGVTLHGTPDRVDRLADGSGRHRRLQERAHGDRQAGRGRLFASTRPARADRAWKAASGRWASRRARTSRLSNIGSSPRARAAASVTSNRPSIRTESAARSRPGLSSTMWAGKFDDAVARWLTGEEPFQARPHSDAPVFTDYDQLMRLDEWIGRIGPGGRGPWLSARPSRRSSPSRRRRRGRARMSG